MYLYTYRKIGSTFCRKNQRIQGHANEFIQSVITSAEKKAGTIQNRNNNNYIDRREQEKSSYSHNNNNDDDIIRDSRRAHEVGPETDSSTLCDSKENRMSNYLFRSGSITAADFDDDIYNSYFIPNEETEDILNTCFPDLFTENNGNESIPYQQCEREILKRYGQFFDYFAEQTREGKIIRRSSMKNYFCYFCENWMRSDGYCRSLCTSYIQTVRYMYIYVY